MDTLIITYTAAIRGIRAARQRDGALFWDPLTKIEQRRCLRSCVPNRASIDFELLERLGFWENRPSETLDVAVSEASHRRSWPNLQCHIISKPLPAGSIMHVAENIYCCSPALSALLYAKDHGLAETLVYIMELLGTYCLPAEATLDICWQGTWPHDIDRFAIEQSHYKREPVTTVRELKAVARWATGSTFATFRQALKIAIAGSASPMETIMYSMLCAPMAYGGFNLAALKDGVRLNHRIDFDHDAILMSSGMPYAVADLYIPVARTDIEYNGCDHETRESRRHDDRRNNGLKGMEIKVVIINRDQMRDVIALEAIARKIYKDAGKRFRYQISGYRTRQAQWLNALRHGIGLPPV